MKILLVSDRHHFSTVNLFPFYDDALKRSGVPFNSVNIGDFNKYLSPTAAEACMYYTAMRHDLGFTHILFLCGLSVTKPMLKSFYDKKVGIISTEDPHGTKLVADSWGDIDYYFTNEKKMDQVEPNVYYVPVGAPSTLPNKNTLPNVYKSDVCFVGTIYPDRAKVIKTVGEYCEKNDKKFYVIGPTTPDTPKQDAEAIKKYVIRNDVVDGKEVLCFYSGAKVTLNLDRDTTWHPTEGVNPNLYKNITDPYSLNPRAYEIGACRTIQLYVNARQEAIDLWGDNIYISTEGTVGKVLGKIFKTQEKALKAKAAFVYEDIVSNHLYEHRVKEMIDIMVKGE